MNNLYNYDPLDQWDPAVAQKKLQELYKEVLSIADANISWYRKYRTRKGGWARGIRLAAVIFFVASTLIPYFASYNTGTGNENGRLLYVGYILAGLGAGLLLLDRYYGYSSSWTRFALTAVDLETMRNLFVEQWQILFIKSIPLTKESFCNLVDAVSKFRGTVNAAVRAETATWATETQERLNELMEKLRTQADYLKTKMDEQRLASDRIVDEADDADDEIPESVFEQAKAEKGDEWKQKYGLHGVGHGWKITEGNRLNTYAIIFYPIKKLEDGIDTFTPIPEYIPYRGYKLPTDVRPLGGIMKATGGPKLLCDSYILKRAGCSIARIEDKNSCGTIGLKVYKNEKPHLLSCYHVLCKPELSVNKRKFDLLSSIGSAVVTSPSREDENDPSKRVSLGSVIDGELDDTLDGAIAEISSQIAFSDEICSLEVKAQNSLTVTKDHANQRLPVRSVGRTSGVLKGVILMHSGDFDVEYFINGKWQLLKLKNVIITDQLANGGDSGAAVLDYDNNVIGIIAATSPEVTCVIPIDRLLRRFTVTLKP